jgi:hypothetical protein
MHDLDGHLDELALDALRTGADPVASARHVAECGECRARLDRLGALAAALAAPAPRVTVPPAQDAALLALAGPAAGRIRGRRRARWAGAGATLAAVAAALALAFLRSPEDRSAAAPIALAAAGPMDVNGDARTDILDAFAVARAIERGDAAGHPGWDVTGDGRVDDADVDALAAAAVALGGAP